jgi:hypothetical protein
MSNIIPGIMLIIYTFHLLALMTKTLLALAIQQ